MHSTRRKYDHRGSSGRLGLPAQGRHDGEDILDRKCAHCRERVGRCGDGGVDCSFVPVGWVFRLSMTCRAAALHTGASRLHSPRDDRAKDLHLPATGDPRHFGDDEASGFLRVPGGGSHPPQPLPHPAAEQRLVGDRGWSDA